MTIEADVDRGLEIRAEILKLAAELKGIEERLEAAGLEGEQVPLEDKDREGRQWIAKGTKDQVAVIFTADSIVGMFAAGSVTHKAITAAAEGKTSQFFKLTWVNRFKDGKDFRAHALEVLGEKAPTLITACLSRDKQGVPRNKTVIAWNEPKPVLQTKEG